eukprot:366525-Chlamydomonas_euryale.AAC.13
MRARCASSSPSPLCLFSLRYFSREPAPATPTPATPDLDVRSVSTAFAGPATPDLDVRSVSTAFAGRSFAHEADAAACCGLNPPRNSALHAAQLVLRADAGLWGGATFPSAP